MPTTSRRPRKFSGPPADTYAALVALLPPRPLHDATDYDAAVEMIGRLAGHALNADQADYLDALMVFVERYQAGHPETDVPASARSGVEVLRALVAEHGLSGADVSRLLGASRTLGPMLLRGERRLTASHARTLGGHFKLDPGVFVR